MQMKWCLFVVLLLQTGFLLDAIRVNRDRFNHLRKDRWIKHIVEKPTNIDPPTGPFCESLVGYYVGEFKNKNPFTPTFNAQFQLRLNADSELKKIHIKVDEWNNNYSDLNDFELDFYYSDSHQWCDLSDNYCYATFSKNVTNFKLDLNHQNGQFFHLLNFDYFNNSFALKDSIGSCTKYQLDGLNDEYTPDLKRLSFCLCCGDEYSPDELLGCPNNKWSQNEATCKPSQPTTKQIKTTTLAPETTTISVPTTTQPPTETNLTCKSVVGFYSGVFQTADNPNPVTVKFQTKLVANDAAQTISFSIDHWDDQSTFLSDVQFYVWTSEESSAPCDYPASQPCSIPYVAQENKFFQIQLTPRSNSGWQPYDFIYFDNFFNSFTIYNTVGQCGKSQPSQTDGHAPDASQFKYCVCCGDNYSPDTQLQCPVNPWN